MFNCRSPPVATPLLRSHRVLYTVMFPLQIAVLGKITYKMISNQNSKSHQRKWFKIKVKDHLSKSDLKSKSKSLVQKDQNQNQNHKDMMQLLQHNIYLQKFSEIMPLYNVHQMHTDTQYSVTRFRWLYAVVFMTSMSKV